MARMQATNGNSKKRKFNQLNADSFGPTTYPQDASSKKVRWESLPAAGSLQACAQHLAGETKSRLLRAIIQFAKENPSSIDEFVKHIKPSTVDVDIESLLQSEMINAKLTEKERINERKQKEAEINKKLNKERNEKREERLRLERHTGRVYQWIHEKNHGFIVMDGAGEQKIRCLKRDCSLKNKPKPDLNPRVGSAVEFSVDNNKALKVTAVGGGKCLGGRERGIVKKWNEDQKRGKIKPDDGSKSIRILTDDDIWEPSKTLKKGDAVLFDRFKKDDSSAVIATYVTLEGSRIYKCSLCMQIGHQKHKCPQLKLKLKGQNAHSDKSESAKS